MTNKQELREAAEKHGDDDILAMLDELEAAEKTSAARLEAIDRTHKMFQREQGRAEAAEKRVADLEAREVTLPRPACTYADHSYPAYSERQVVALLESLGIRINGEG